MLAALALALSASAARAGSASPEESWCDGLAAVDPPAEASDSAQLEETEPTGELSLRQALSAALLGNPALSATSWAVRAQEARALQAGLLPNPGLDVEVENFGGTGQRSGVEQTETTVQLSQLVPIGAKIAKRERVANLQEDLACWDYASTRIDVLTTATKAFVTLLEAQQRYDLVRELEQVSRAGVASIARQVGAGAVPPVAEVRAEVVLRAVQLDGMRAKRAVHAASYALAASWGGRAPRFAGVRGDLRSGVVEPPHLSELVGRVDSNPDLARWGTELAERQARLSLAEAMRLPDPTVRFAGRHFSDSDDVAFVVGVSIPLPLFDRNQGGSLAAARDVETARASRDSAEVAVRAALAQRYQELAAAFVQAMALEEDALPAAQEAFDGTREGYRRGTFRYLDVLDAQRTLYDLRGRELAALATYHRARADIERLLGEPIEQNQVRP